MHLKILYFIRNYDFTDYELIDEIAKQFNITMDIASKELEYVRERYNKIIKKKSRNINKKVKKLPKSKPPGIGIDIQGRDRNNYKIRITGSRDKDQLNDIIIFIKTLIYLYIETYLYNKKEYQIIKDKLKNLTKIAKRRNKVIDIVDYDTTISTVKTIIAKDKSRLGFKPNEGQNQWTRSCQNSGNKKRRPGIISDDKINDIINDGYKINNNTGFYEKKIKLKNNSIIIKAIKLSSDNNIYNYYTCDEKENGEYIYIGFLSKSSNPNKLCMPCCFKKDQMISNNKNKKNYFLKCVGQTVNNNIQDKTLILNEKVYILQETNKIQDNRFIFLPKYLDILFNKIWKYDNIIENHYFIKSISGYYFKYTITHEYYNFLIVLENIYSISIKDIINKFVSFLEKDKSNIYYTYLNNGDISKSFNTKKEYIEYIKTSKYLEYDIIGELSAIPNVISPSGINYYIFTKHTKIIKKNLEKDISDEQYYLECLNLENYDQLNEDRDIIFLIKDSNYFFPIYNIKKDKNDKRIILNKYYSKNKINNIISEVNNFHNISCRNNFINIILNNNLIAKNIITILENNKINIFKQIIDNRNKCKYIKINNGLVIPTKLSGINYNYKFEYIQNISSELLDFNNTIKLLADIEKILKLDYIPKSIYYDNKNNDKINIISILLNNNLIIPIINEIKNEKDIKNNNLSIIFQSLEETIDNDIINNNIPTDDDRIINIHKHYYMNESYNLYRLELSLYLDKHKNIKEKIINIVRNNDSIISDKKNKLRYILFTILNKKLSDQYKLFINTDNDDLNIKSYVADITDKLPDLKNYNIKNIRDYCNINTTMNKCNNNLHCNWNNNSCNLLLLDNLASDFVNKVIEECIQDGIKFQEIIQENEYYVSDIGNYTLYTDRDNQKIIKASNITINKVLSELFGKSQLPIIGKKQFAKIKKSIVDDQIPDLIEIGKQLSQEIIPNQDSIIRAFINSYYWINNQLFDKNERNLGYYSYLQTNIMYLFKAKIIDFIQNIYNVKDNKNILNYFKNYFNNEYYIENILNKLRKTSFNTDGKIELYILSHLINIPIVVYDNYSNIKYIYLQGNIEVNDKTIDKFTNDEVKHKTIFLKFIYDNVEKNIPRQIFSIYYL